MVLLKTVTIIALCFLLLGCNNHSKATNSLYFTSPESAVEKVTVMLKNKDWPQLTKYYDLGDSTIEKSTLISGQFFYTDERPESAHPAGFWHYKHPFPPGFKYLSSRNLTEQSIIEVTVNVEIDQGGGMIQRGEKNFLMSQSVKGLQILPR